MADPLRYALTKRDLRRRISFKNFKLRRRPPPTPSGGRGNEKIPAHLSGVGVMRMRFPGGNAAGDGSILTTRC